MKLQTCIRCDAELGGKFFFGYVSAGSWWYTYLVRKWMKYFTVIEVPLSKCQKCIDIEEAKDAN